MPIISIIIPTYNVGGFLSSTLDSIRNQTFEDWECILVDDGSNDNTVVVAQEYVKDDNRFRLMQQVNSGPSVARNYGYSLSNPASLYVTFMDSDDVWAPEALQLLQDELVKFPGAAGAHGLADFIDSEGKPLNPGQFADMGRKRREVRGRRRVWLKTHEPTTFAGLCNDNVLFPPGLWLARRSAYHASGGFDTRIKGSEDWDTLVNLSRQGELRFINRIILLYRRHQSNLGAAEATRLVAYTVFCKTFYSPLNTPFQRQLVRNGWRAYQIESLKERVSATRQLIKKGDYKAAILSLARVPVHLWRFLRGKPGLRSLSPEMRKVIKS